jgi:D-glycero-D-manno-heptose 1,7-bisphosphate phosphatase
MEIPHDPTQPLVVQFTSPDSVEDVKKAFLLDRDGVINPNVRRLISPDKMEVLPGVGDAIALMKEKGYLVLIVTNQPIVSKGFCTYEDMNKVHEEMMKQIKEQNPKAEIDGIYLCPHHPKKGFDGEVPELKLECSCRKPKTGLLDAALNDYGLSKEECYMVGDSESDIIAGKAADVGTTVFLTEGGGSFTGKPEGKDSKNPENTEKEDGEAEVGFDADIIAPNLPEAVSVISKE